MFAPPKRYIPLLIVLLLMVVAFIGVLVQHGSAVQGGSALMQMLLVGGLCATALVAFVFFEQANSAKRDLALLHEKMGFHNMLLEALPDAYLVAAPNGQVTQRQGLEKLLGNAPILILQDFYELLQPASAEKLQHFMKDAAKEDEFRVQVTLKAGRAILVQGMRRIGMPGQPPATVLWLRDVSRFAEEIRKQGDVLHQANHQMHEFRALLNQLPFPVWLRGRDLKLSWCNEAYAKAVAQSADKVVADQVELVPLQQRPKGKTLAEAACERGGEQSEDRHVVIDNQRHLLHIAEACIGPEKIAVGYAIDISKEAELDSELKRHIKAHEEVLEQLGTPIAIYSSDTRIKFYNRSYVKLWEADENYLKTEPTFNEILEDLRTRRRAPEQADFQKYKKERMSLFTSLIEPREDLMHLPDGTTLRIMAIPHPFGGIMFVHEDVTDKLALESAYNTQLAVQRETLDNLAEGIAVYGSDGKLRLYNPAFLRIWHLAQDPLDEHPHISEMLELMRPLLLTDDWAAFKKDTISDMLDRNDRAGRYTRTDGSVVEFSALPLPDGAVMVSYLDVSDTVLAEQALRETNTALTAADRLKSEFVANVSYQLRTPLNTIMGFAEILANQYFGTLNERQLEYARTMMEASKKLLALINDVLDLATIEAGRMVLDYKSVSVKALLEAAAGMTREWAQQKNIGIVIQGGDGVGQIDADEQRLKQVMFNLINNAIQYSESGGTITLSAERDGDWVGLSVQDTGLGIAPEDQERIFEKFERANPESRQSGAGLGLSLVKSFVELHGGRIVIDSNPGQGTKVTCLIPIEPPEQALLQAS